MSGKILKQKNQLPIKLIYFPLLYYPPPLPYSPSFPFFIYSLFTSLSLSPYFSFSPSFSRAKSLFHLSLKSFYFHIQWNILNKIKYPSFPYGGGVGGEGREDSQNKFKSATNITKKFINKNMIKDLNLKKCFLYFYPLL